MFIVAVVIGLALVVTLVAHSGMRTWVNYASVTAATWAISFVLANTLGSLVPGLSEGSTWVVLGVLVSLIVMSAQSLVKGQPSVAPTIDVQRLVRLHVWSTILLMGYVVQSILATLPLIQALGGWSALWAGGGGSFRLEMAAQRAASLDLSDGLLSRGLGYILFMGHLSVLSGGLLWRLGRRALAILPILILLLLSLVTFERTSLMMAGLMMISVVALPISLNGRKPLRRPRNQLGAIAEFRGRIAVAGAIAVGVLVPLIARNSGSDRATGLVSVAQYGVSGIVGLDARFFQASGWTPVDLATGQAGSIPGWGAYTFYGMFDIFGRIGFSVPFSPRSWEYVDVQAFGARLTTNVSTLLSDLFLDFGLIGAGAMWILTLILLETLRRRIMRGSLVLVGFYSIAFAAVSWSFFGNAILADFRYLVLAVCWYFVEKLLLREELEERRLVGSSASALTE